MRLRAAPGPRADVGLFDTPAVDVNLGERSAIAVLSISMHGELTAGDHRLQAALGCPAARLVEFRRVDVREANLLVIAYERIAVDGEAALAAIGAQRNERYQHR